MRRFIDLYALLGVPSNASAEAIATAYEKRAAELDAANPSPEEREGRLAWLRYAFAILGDPRLRMAYDFDGSGGYWEEPAQTQARQADDGKREEAASVEPEPRVEASRQIPPAEKSEEESPSATGDAKSAGSQAASPRSFPKISPRLRLLIAAPVLWLVGAGLEHVSFSSLSHFQAADNILLGLRIYAWSCWYVAFFLLPFLIRFVFLKRPMKSRLLAALLSLASLLAASLFASQANLAFRMQLLVHFFASGDRYLRPSSFAFADYLFALLLLYVNASVLRYDAGD